MNMPAPKLFTSLPDASNLRIGSRLDPSQAKGSPGLYCVGGANAPQRSATHTLVPSGSISTPEVEPQVRPSGNLAQSSIERYGLGAEFVAAPDWAKDRFPIPSTKVMPIPSMTRTWSRHDMMVLSCMALSRLMRAFRSYWQVCNQVPSILTAVGSDVAIAQRPTPPK